MSASSLSLAEVTDQVDPRHWRVVEGVLRATFATGDFVTGLGLVTRVADVAEEAEHHPDLDLRYGRVHVALVSHDVGALTERDTALAARISAIADELGLEGEPAAPRRVTIAIDTLDADAIRPFWKAALGYDESDGDLVDPDGISRRCGSSGWTSRGRSATASISTCWCRWMSPSNGWARSSRPAARW